MKRLVGQVAALLLGVAALVGVLGALGLNPDPVRVSLLALLAWLALALLTRVAASDRAPWPRAEPASASTPTDDRFTTYLHLLEDNERARTPDATLADRLNALAGEQVVPRTTRLSRRQIADALNRIEER
jgi:hypothetical protein